MQRRRGARSKGASTWVEGACAAAESGREIPYGLTDTAGHGDEASDTTTRAVGHRWQVEPKAVSPKRNLVREVVVPLEQLNLREPSRQSQWNFAAPSQPQTRGRRLGVGA